MASKIVEIPVGLRFKDFKPNPELILVHLNKEEAKYFDKLQGGMSLDHELEIREYSKLSPIISMPQVREIFLRVLGDLEDDGDIDPEMKQLYKEANEADGPDKFYEAPGDEAPPAKHIADEGNPGDTELALLPIDFADFVDDIRGYTSTNEKTGLREYWGFLPFLAAAVIGGGAASTGVFGKKVKNIGKEALRIGATVAGAAFGGPIGAGLGNMAGQMITGRKLGDAAMHGLKAGALTYGVNQLAAAAGMGSLAGLSDGYLGGMTGAGTAGGASGAASLLGGGGGAAGGGGLLSMNTLAPIGLLAGAGMLLKKGHKQAGREREAEWQEDKRMHDEVAQKYNRPLDPQLEFYREPIDPKLSAEQQAQGMTEPSARFGYRPYKGYKKGGGIKRQKRFFGGNLNLDLSDVFKGIRRGSPQAKAHEPNPYLLDEAGEIKRDFTGQPMFNISGSPQGGGKNSGILSIDEAFKTRPDCNVKYKDFPEHRPIDFHPDVKKIFEDTGGIDYSTVFIPKVGFNVWEENEAQRVYNEYKKRKEKSLKFNTGDDYYLPAEKKNVDANPLAREEAGQTSPGYAYEYKPQMYKKGGAVRPHNPHEYVVESRMWKGKGKGQDDTIKCSPPHGSYIIDATTTAHLGDGSSEAGAQVLKDFENKLLRRHKAKGGPVVHAKSPLRVPALLSNDEYQLSPATVTVIGDGDNSKGSKILDGVVKKVRKFKASNGEQLPPAMKPLKNFFPKSLQSLI